MNEVRVQRTGLGPLVFTGTLLARSSSKRVGKDRWTELELYVTEAGNYVSAVIGQTTRPSEEIRYAALSHTTPEAAIQSFFAKGQGRLSLPALDLLDEASEKDARLAAAFDAFEDTPQHVR